MFVIISGTCVVTSSRHMKVSGEGHIVAKLTELDIVGESMICEEQVDRVRMATVTASVSAEESMEESQDAYRRGGVQVLTLYRSDYDDLVESGVVGRSDMARIQSAMRMVRSMRQSDNELSLQTSTS